MKSLEHFEVLHAHAAGIDVGKSFFDVCAREGVVKRFGSYSEDLEAVSRYLREEGIETIAMESSGPYWKNLFTLLQHEGFEVYLVNPSYAKNVRNRKSDRLDAQWLRKLHSCGLLPNSFQPGPLSEQLRGLSRHRRSLIQQADANLNKANKALVLLNIRLDRILSSLNTKSARQIIEAIIKGQRDPAQLVKLLDRRVKVSREEALKALKGLWRPEILFELKQSYGLYEHFWELIHECDTQIEAIVDRELAQRQQLGEVLPEYQPVKKKAPQVNDPTFDVYQKLYQLSGGVDLAEILGVGATTLLTLLAEVGVDDLGKHFPSGKHFSSWLSLTPNRKVSGGRVLSSALPKSRNPLRQMLQSAANAIGNSTKPSALRSFFRKKMQQKGRKVAIMATARKLSIIIYNMITKQQPYQPIPDEKYQKMQKENIIRKTKKKFKELGISKEELRQILDT